MASATESTEGPMTMTSAGRLVRNDVKVSEGLSKGGIGFRVGQKFHVWPVLMNACQRTVFHCWSIGGDGGAWAVYISFFFSAGLLRGPSRRLLSCQGLVCHSRRWLGGTV